MTLSVITAFTISEPAVKTPCPLPYVDVDGKYCFYITLTEQNFTSSNAVCQETNGFLAQINTEEKNASFVKYVEGRFYFCLFLFDILSEFFCSTLRVISSEIDQSINQSVSQSVI